MSQSDLRAVHKELQQRYDAWACHLRTLGIDFFINHTPVLVLSRFGQNLPVLRSPIEGEAEQWASAYNWSAIAKVAYAGAHVARQADCCQPGT